MLVGITRYIFNWIIKKNAVTELLLNINMCTTWNVIPLQLLKHNIFLNILQFLKMQETILFSKFLLIYMSLKFWKLCLWCAQMVVIWQLLCLTPKELLPALLLSTLRLIIMVLSHKDSLEWFVHEEDTF